MKYAENPSNSAYAEFVSALYFANGGNLSEHIKQLCENSENVFVRTIGRGEQAPEFMHSALLKELDVLQEVSRLTKDELCKELHYEGFLPEFTSSEADLKSFYLNLSLIHI